MLHHHLKLTTMFCKLWHVAGVAISFGKLGDMALFWPTIIVRALLLLAMFLYCFCQFQMRNKYQRKASATRGNWSENLLMTFWKMVLKNGERSVYAANSKFLDKLSKDVSKTKMTKRNLWGQLPSLLKKTNNIKFMQAKGFLFQQLVMWERKFKSQIQ